jgi:capsid protein
MNARIHPLSGVPMNGKSVNGKPRAELAEYFGGQQKARMSIDAARSGTDLDGHWRFADSLNADLAYSQSVRHTLVKRSRYEQTSNAYYIGAIRSYVSSLIGDGPKLRMLSGSRDFNQLVEREFFAWQERVQFRRKLKAMAHAMTGDGETFAIIQNNPSLPGEVQLDFMPFEAEQCQSDWAGYEAGHVDGIYFDEFNNVVAYDILPEHPGSDLGSAYGAVKVPASNVLHWFNLERPGAHRGIPAMTSGLSTGALARRHREATVKAAEVAASIGAILTTNAGAETEPDELRPFTTAEFVHRMMMVAPMGWDAKQMKGEHPNAQYQDFHRLNISEMVRGISMPFNAAACDSSTYSFASGKLDTLLFRNQINGDRADCNELVCDRLFAAWFREWTILEGRRDIPPTHQWDWPTHPVIDAVAEAKATDTKLKNGTISLRQAYSDQGKDLEDELVVLAEDTFGDASEENIAKARQMLRLINTPQHAIQYVAQLIGLQPVASGQQQPSPGPETDISGETEEQIRAMARRLEILERRSR